MRYLFKKSQIILFKYCADVKNYENFKGFKLQTTNKQFKFQSKVHSNFQKEKKKKYHNIF